MQEKLLQDLKALSQNTSLEATRLNSFIILLKCFKTYVFGFVFQKKKPCLYYIGNKAFLASTSIHLEEAHNLFGPTESSTELSLGPPQALILKAQCLLVSLKVLLKPIQASKYFRTHHFLFHWLTFAYELHNSQLLKIALLKTLPSSIDSIFCFELGSTGHAVSSLGSQTLKSGYIQHGLLSRFCYPVHFDKYYVWTGLEASYFKKIGQNSYFETLYKAQTTYQPVHLMPSKDHIIFFALEYPTQRLPQSLISSVLKNLVDEVKRSSWTLVLRPHPRAQFPQQDLSLLKQPNVFLDPYKNLNIDESFLKNNASIFLTLSSASTIKIWALNKPCFYIKNKITDSLVFPLDNFAHGFEDTEKFLSHLKQSSTLT